MLQHYLAQLTIAIRQNDKIKAHTQLKASQWTRSCYDIAADIIGDALRQQLNTAEQLQLGTTLSAKTLSNIFKGAYRLAYPIDPRTLNTLTKIVRFLGFSDWEAFAAHCDADRQQISENTSPEDAAEYVLRAAIEAEFRFYQDLPAIQAAMHGHHYLLNGPAFNRVMDHLLHFKGASLHIANPFNPSFYEILELEVLQASAMQVRFRTREYWLLCWWSDGISRYARRHKSLEDHFHTMLFIENRWQLKSNATMADVTETEEEL